MAATVIAIVFGVWDAYLFDIIIGLFRLLGETWRLTGHRIYYYWVGACSRVGALV